LFLPLSHAPKPQGPDGNTFVEPGEHTFIALVAEGRVQGERGGDGSRPA